MYWGDSLVGNDLWADVLGDARVAGGGVSVSDGQWGLVCYSQSVWLSNVSNSDLLVSQSDLWVSVGNGNMCMWLVSDSDGVWLDQVLLHWNDLFADDGCTMDWGMVDIAFTLDDSVETVVSIGGVVDNATATIGFYERV